MSRTALRRQDDPSGNRTWHAEDIFRAACDEGRNHKGALAIWGDDTSFHFNPLLLKNCIQSSYFQKCCETLMNWSAVIDEIFYEVKNVSAFSHQKQPSTAFCLLLRLLTLRMTSHQLNLTLKHADSPFIRAIGFLYLRFAGPPDRMYEWIAPYLYDEEEFSRTERVEHKREAAAHGKMTMGDFVRYIFQSRDYYGETTLPRWPLAVERTLDASLVAADAIADRALQHFSNPSRMEYFSRLGSQVMALYGDDENPVTWYQAVVDRVVMRDESASPEVPYKFPRFVVTFTEYGNTETVHLGEMDVTKGADNHVGSRGNSRGNAEPRYGYNERSGHEVRQRETNRATDANDSFAWTHRQGSAHNPKPRSGYKHGTTDSKGRDESNWNASRSDAPKEQIDNGYKRDASTASIEPPRKRSAEEAAAMTEKKRKLAAKYC